MSSDIVAEMHCNARHGICPSCLGWTPTPQSKIRPGGCCYCGEADGTAWILDMGPHDRGQPIFCRFAEEADDEQ